VITVGAIDCAQDVNMPTCREYEVSNKRTAHAQQKVIRKLLYRNIIKNSDFLEKFYY
jgi:hypothetical protein